MFKNYITVKEIRVPTSYRTSKYIVAFDIECSIPWVS